MVMVVYSVLSAVVLLHALCAAWLTFSGPRERLWERLALMTTLLTMLLALGMLIPAFTMRGFEFNALAFGGRWLGALVLEGLCIFAVRRASSRVATASVFLVLFSVPMTWVVREGMEYRRQRSHRHCLVYEFRNADGTVATVVPTGGD
jgi:hypothetical protein